MRDHTSTLSTFPCGSTQHVRRMRSGCFNVLLNLKVMNGNNVKHQSHSTCNLFLDLELKYCTHMKQAHCYFFLIKVSVRSYSAREWSEPGRGSGTYACQSYQLHSSLSEIGSLVLIFSDMDFAVYSCHY